MNILLKPRTQLFGRYLVVSTLVFLLCGTAYSGTITVTSVGDSGSGSLRSAITSAAAGDTITFGVIGVIALSTGPLSIDKSLTINGPGATQLIISGNNSNRIFIVQSNIAAAISGVTIQDGAIRGLGGGMLNAGNLALNNCVIGRNSSSPPQTSSSGGLGGGIYNVGTLALTNCLVTNNSVVSLGYPFSGFGGLGAGIYNQGVMTLDLCIISGNWCADSLGSTGGTRRESSGGGIYNSDSLTIFRSRIINNHAGNGFDDFGDSAPGDGGTGGGIYNVGSLSLLGSTVSGNSCGNGGSGTRYGFSGRKGGGGGGIWNGGRLLTINCTISSNLCGNGGTGGQYGIQNSTTWPGGMGGSGGGILNTGTLAMTNCTIAANVAGNGGKGANVTFGIPPLPNGGDGGSGGSGGGIWSQGSLTLCNCTITADTAGSGGIGGNGYPGQLPNIPPTPPGSKGADGTGGGVALGGGSAQLVNALVAGNVAAGAGLDVSGSFISLGYNLVGNAGGSTGFGSNGDLLNLNPLLGPLTDNGGPTFTCALSNGSPGIDAATSSGAPAFDQRGIGRPQGASFDIGAFEVVTLTVRIPPSISQQPASLVVTQGQNATFVAAAIGNQPLTYQWRFNGNNIGGASGTSHTVTGATAVNAGSYSVVVSNPYGSVTSSVATLTVRIPPSITQQPASLVVTQGQNAEFGVAAIGDLPLTYQWRFNGNNLGGANGTSHTVTGATALNTGGYSVVVSNPYGMTTSSLATLTVRIPPSITQQPASLIVTQGQNATFTTTAAGDPTLTYQWRLNGNNLGGANGTSYMVIGATTANVGSYDVVVSNPYGSVTSGVAILRITARGNSVIAWGNNNFGQTNVPADLINPAAVFGGESSSLALRDDQTVKLWGNDDYYQTDYLLGLTNVVAIAAGSYHSLLLLRGGLVLACGRDFEGQLAVPDFLTNAVAVAAGAYHSLALTDGAEVKSWGANFSGETEVPRSLKNVVSIAAGGSHSLALISDGRIVSWGNNQYGQTNIPPGLLPARAVAAGRFHSLALLDRGNVVCWGRNNRGQTNVPAGLSEVIAIAAGDEHSLALRTDGSVIIWGSNESGQTNKPPGLLKANAIAGGGRHSLAIEGNPIGLNEIRLRDPEFKGTAFSVRLTTDIGKVYSLESAEALNEGHWTVRSLVLGDGQTKALRDARAISMKQFYRVRRW